MCAYVSDQRKSGPVDGSRIFPPIPRQARSESVDTVWFTTRFGIYSHIDVSRCRYADRKL